MRLLAFPQWDKLISLHGCALSCRLMRQDGHVFVTSFLDNFKQPFRIVLISIGQSGAQYDCCIFHCQNCRADSSNVAQEVRGRKKEYMLDGQKWTRRNPRQIVRM